MVLLGLSPRDQDTEVEKLHANSSERRRRKRKGQQEECHQSWNNKLKTKKSKRSWKVRE